MALLGKEVRMSRLVNPKSNKMMAITVDHAISRGIAPMTGIQDIQGAIDKIVAGRPDAMTMTGPIAERCLEKHAGKVSLLCKISSYSPVSPTQDAVFGTVDSAIALGADAVSMGCMTLGDFQNEQFEAIGKVAQECRLKGAYLIRCTGCVKDDDGNVTEILAEYDPESRGGDPADGRKVKGATLHWVDAATAVDAEVRLYDNLFSDPSPDAADKDFIACLNPDSLQVLTGCKVEAGLANATAPANFQFMRLGYFCLDNKDAKPGHLVFNRSVSLKDSFKK